jgi:predicted alpha/beta hydrolase
MPPSADPAREPTSATDAGALGREPFVVTCADGWVLRGELVSAPAPRAVALVGHAMMVDRRTLDRPRGRGLVSTLAARGIACVWPDLRGHGASGPRAGEGGDWGYDDLVEHDVAALAAFARARFPSLPLAAVGHSLFAHVALAHVARHPESPIDGLALLACNVANPEWARRPLERWAKRALMELAALGIGLVGRVPARRLGLGSDDEPAGYVRDFLTAARRGRWLARDGFDYYGALATMTRPVLAVIAAGDRLMAPEADARGLVAPVPRAEVRVVGRASGLPFDPGHMGLVLDERARPAWEEIADFILALPPR